jgi:hypothetical protein
LRILRNERNNIIYSDFRNALVLTEGKLITNKRAHEAETNPCRGSNFDHPLWTPIWTKTIVAHPPAFSAFGDTLEVADASGKLLVLDTRSFKGEKGCALAFDDHQIRAEGKTLVFLPDNIRMVPNFPQKCDNQRLFRVDPETGLPVLGSKGSIALWRRDDAFIAPAVRAVHQAQLPAVWLSYGFNHEFGMMVED